VRTAIPERSTGWTYPTSDGLETGDLDPADQPAGVRRSSRRRQRTRAAPRWQTQVGSVTVRLPAGTTYAIDTGSQVSVADVKVQQDPGSPHRITAHSQVGSVSVYNG
jgi:hypothetical protein